MEKDSWSDDTVWLDKAQTQGFQHGGTFAESNGIRSSRAIRGPGGSAAWPGQLVARVVFPSVGSKVHAEGALTLTGR